LAGIRTLATHQTTLAGIALSPTALYWAAGGYQMQSDGNVAWRQK